MKKLVFAAIASASILSLRAQENDNPFENEPDLADQEEESARVVTTAPVRQVAQWPVFFAICEFPETPDIVGIRLTLPFSTKQESVTGFDIGLWGRTGYFEGLMLNALRNDVKDSFAGIQVGLYNSIGRGDLFALQAGLWNEAGSLNGLQVGLVNTVGECEGFQIGFINRAESLHGFQVGVINAIRDNQIVFMPVLNVGF